MKKLTALLCIIAALLLPFTFAIGLSMKEMAEDENNSFASKGTAVAFNKDFGQNVKIKSANINYYFESANTIVFRITCHETEPDGLTYTGTTVENGEYVNERRRDGFKMTICGNGPFELFDNLNGGETESTLQTEDCIFAGAAVYNENFIACAVRVNFKAGAPEKISGTVRITDYDGNETIDKAFEIENELLSTTVLRVNEVTTEKTTKEKTTKEKTTKEKTTKETTTKVTTLKETAATTKAVTTVTEEQSLFMHNRGRKNKALQEIAALTKISESAAGDSPGAEEKSTENSGKKANKEAGKKEEKEETCTVNPDTKANSMAETAALTAAMEEAAEKSGALSDSLKTRIAVIVCAVMLFAILGIMAVRSGGKGKEDE